MTRVCQPKCKLREIHSSTILDELVLYVAPMGVVRLIVYYHRVVFTTLVSQPFSGCADWG